MLEVAFARDSFPQTAPIVSTNCRGFAPDVLNQDVLNQDVLNQDVFNQDVFNQDVFNQVPASIAAVQGSQV